MKKRRIANMKTLWTVGFLIVVSTMFTMVGCSKKTSNSVTNPNPNTFEPKGTIQGHIVDRVTSERIAGAKVSIGIAETTTDAFGFFIFKDVPATNDATKDGSNVSSGYAITADLSGVTSPANGHYPKFVNGWAQVDFTSLNDSSPCDPNTSPYYYYDSNNNNANCGATSTNHDTPVDKLVNGDNNIYVAKQDANIEGVVAGCENTPSFWTKTADVYKVEIFNDESSDVSDEANTGSGAYGHKIWEGTTTDGKFTAQGLEEDLYVKIVVTGPTTGDKAFSMRAERPYSEESLKTPTDAGTLKLTNIQASNAIHVCSIDIHGPRVTSVTPEPGSDISAGVQTVEIAFSEPIKQNASTSTDPAGVGNLFDNIEVYFDGSKAGNTAYSLAWNSTFDKLTVTMPDTGISSLYHVRITDINDKLKDANGLGVGEDTYAGNFVDMGACPDDSKVPWSINPDGTYDGDNDCTAYFSTKGSQTPVAPVLSLVNANSINEADARVALFDWPQASGAKTYKMYCRKVQKWGTTEQAHGYTEFSSNVAGSSATIDFGTDENRVSCDDLDEVLYGQSADDDCSSSESTSEFDYELYNDEQYPYFDLYDENDAFVENNEIQIVYDCYVVGISADKTEGAKSNVVRVADAKGPKLVEDTYPSYGKLSCPSTSVDPETGAADGTTPKDIGTICDDPDNPDLITKIVLGFNEEVTEDSAENAANYTFTNLAVGGSGAVDTTPGVIVYDPLRRLVLLPLSDGLDWIKEVKGVGIPVMRTGADGILQTSVKSGSDDVIPSYIASAGGVIATSGTYTGPCVDYGTDVSSATTVSSDDVAVGTVIYAGPNGKCDSIANSLNSSGDDIQVVPVGGYSGVCGIETGVDVVEAGDDVDTDGGAGAGLILTGANGVCDTLAAAYTTATATQTEPSGLSTGNSAGILPGPDGVLDTTTPNPISDDEVESASAGTAVKVTNVKDIAGNVIQTTADEFTAGGEVK